MPTISRSALRGRRLRTIVLAALLGVGLSAGTAYAQDDPTNPPTSEEAVTTTETTVETTTPTETVPPVEDDKTSEPPVTDDAPQVLPPAVSTASACVGDAGLVEVTLTNPNDFRATYVVDLEKDAASQYEDAVAVDAGATEMVVFENVRGGDYGVNVIFDGKVVVTSAASVDRCDEITEPVDDPLQVFVRCENGEGLVTIRVFNLEGESRTYTVSVDDIGLGAIELGTAEYAVVVDEAMAPDGSYAVRVVAEGIDHTETVDVACAPAPPTSTTPTTSTTPVPQARAASDDDLASTGASVGGMALLAALTLAAGGGLLVVSRRRRAAQSDGTDS